MADFCGLQPCWTNAATRKIDEFPVFSLLSREIAWENSACLTAHTSNLAASISGDGYGGVKPRNSAGFGALCSPASVSEIRETS